MGNKMDKVKKILYIFMAAAVITMPIFTPLATLTTAPVFALPEPPPLEALEQNTDTNSPPLETNEPYEQSVEIKPSSGEIEKNSFQEPYDKSDLKNEVVPATQGEIFRILVMFLKVMAAVLACAVVIYLMLLVVRKYYYKAETKEYEDKTPQTPPAAPEINGDLKSPNDENEALKNFLSQTKNR